MFWNNRYILNHDTIDEHHKQLIQSLSKFTNEGEITKDELLDEISFLVNYTKFHFSYEESLMIKSGYPLYESHKNNHKAFISQIDTWFNDFNNLPPVVPYTTCKDMTTFAINWLNKHILMQDRTFVDYLQKKNL